MPKTYTAQECSGSKKSEREVTKRQVSTSRISNILRRGHAGFHSVWDGGFLSLCLNARKKHHPKSLCSLWFTGS